MSEAFIAGATIALVISAAAYILIAYSAKSPAGKLSTYLYGGSTLSDQQIFGTIYASGLSFATVIVALIQLGVVFGLALGWAIITYCAGWLLFVGVSSRIRGQLLPHETIHSFLGRCYRSGLLRRFSSTATIIGFVGSFAIEILAIHLILGAFISEESARIAIISLMAAATISYAVIGGFPAVIKTDKYQSYLIVITVIIILVISILYRKSSGQSGLVDEESLRKITLPIQLAISLFFINVAFPIVDMAAWQRAKAASSRLALRRGAIIAVALFFITWSMLLISSMAVIGVDITQQHPVVAIIGYAGHTVGFFGFATGFILLMGLLAAMFSTADTFLNAAATSMYIDQIGHSTIESGGGINVLEKLSSRKLKTWAAVLGTTGFVTCLALNQIGFGIVALIFALYGGTLSLLPSVTLALYMSDTIKLAYVAPWALGSVITGFATSWAIGLQGVLCADAGDKVCNTLNIYISPNAYQAPTYALVVSVAVMAVGYGSILLKRRKR